jgi:hypothetical protein
MSSVSAQIGSGGHSVSYSVRAQGCFLGQVDREDFGVKVTMHLSVVPRLRMNGVMPSLLHAFMACTGATLCLLTDNLWLGK